MVAALLAEPPAGFSGQYIAETDGVAIVTVK
jgi:hypothetical protein